MGNSSCPLERENMKIMLVCYGGLSTSFLVNNMKNTIQQSEKFRDRGIIIEAWGKEEYINQLNDCDIILLGPQVSVIQKDVETEIKKRGFNIPVVVMNKEDYGMMAATPILISAFKKIKEHKESLK